MKRTLFYSTVALLAGIYGAHFFSETIPYELLGLLLLVLLVLLFYKKPVFVYFSMVLCFLFGVLYLQSFGDVKNRLLYCYVNEYITVSGEVIEAVEYDEKDGTQTFIANLRRLSFLGEELELQEKVRLKTNAGEKTLSFGDSFQAVCILEVPTGRQNTGGFDYELYLKSKKIFFMGTVEPGTVSVTGKFPLSFSQRLYHVNRKCGEAISQRFPEEPASVLRAISLGDKSGISDSLYESLKVSGLSHMIAVSGMHVTTFLTVIYVFLSVIKRNKYKFFIPICGVILLFMLFAGASPSVVRAAVMSVLSMVAYVCYRKADALTSLGFSAGIIALLNPFAVFDTGFILSFAATLGILLFAGPMQGYLFRVFRLTKRRGRIAKAIKGVVATFCVTLSVQIFMLPITAALFGYVSLWSFITNIVASPILAVLLVGGLLVGFLGLIHPTLTLPVAGFTYPFIKLFLWIVRGFGSLEFGLVTVGTFSLFAVYVYILFLFAVHRLLHKKYRQTLAAAVAVLILSLCGIGIHYASPTMNVTFVNVGQGDCTLIRLPGQVTVLIDGGGMEYESDYDVGKEVVVPYLKRQGVTKLTYMVASHPHADHIGGLRAVIDAIPVETLLVPLGFETTKEGQAFLDYAKQNRVTIVTVAAGDVQRFSRECFLECLMPDHTWLETEPSENNRSLVFRLSYGNNHLLFTGDLESEGEAYLLANRSDLANITVLKVGHHGSDNATSKAFLAETQPQYVYIPCGKNRFGHPAEAVLQRLAERKAVVYRADYDLDVTFTFNLKKLLSIQKGGTNP
ncbi:MAG: DNA internalization-related competence protein ComEC/Rec2 [Clostridia bacterium]|nr:DNA internalization-related competence protein ComEC/Rec2 [Clostridia bacterium]